MKLINSIKHIKIMFMKTRVFTLIMLLIIASGKLYSQQCNCSDQLAFAIEKTEANYAGFSDKVTEATRQKYNEHTQLFKSKAAKEKNTESCLKLVRDWLGFFKDGHLEIRKKTEEAGFASARDASAINGRFYFRNLDAETNLIRIASFNHLYKKVIDSIIKANYSVITSTKYLLIDLRGNGGGSDVSYEELMPFIYTNPIHVVGMDKLSTPDNIAKYETILKDDNYPQSTREYAKKIIERLKANPGKFLAGDDDTFRLKAILPFPALVGVLVDKKCGSTTEQFLLAAKQSKKVVMFGENSAGVLDYANMHFLNFPCYEWRLGYATSRSRRLPEQPVDNIGISPDIHLESYEKDWVSYASEYVKEMPSVNLSSFNYTDTANVDLHRVAFEVAGRNRTTYDKVRNIIWWTNKNFFWAYTDYQKRTDKQIICRQGGNCNEQAIVVRALLNELNVKTRRTAEINIQPESERRQKDAEKRIAEIGNRASVFGYRHNDHVWIEFFDDEAQEWVPADPTIGLIGLENWLKSRIGFEPRINHAILATAEMLVPIAIFARNPDGSIGENRSEYYLVQSFNKVYKNQLEKLPAWKQWRESIEFIQYKAKDAFDGKVNLHDYTENIKQVKLIYGKLKDQFTGFQKYNK